MAIQRTAAKGRWGYAKKPWFVKLAASLLLGLAPLQFFFALAMSGHPDRFSPAFVAEILGRLSSAQWMLIVSTMTAGAALLYVRRATLLLAVAACVGLIAYNLFATRSFAWPLALFAILLLATPFSRPYLNQGLRWWERASRYRLPGLRLRDAKDDPFEVVDISASGCCVRGPSAHALEGAAVFRIPGLDFEIPARLVRADDRDQGYRFELTPSRRRRLARHLRHLNRNPAARAKAADSAPPSRGVSNL